MIKYLGGVILGILCILSQGNAYWDGWVTYNGGSAANGATVEALGGSTPIPSTTTDYYGYYNLNEQNGMVNGQWYDCVYAHQHPQWDAGHTYGGHCDGETYYSNQNVRKNITLSYPPGYCDSTK